MSHLQTYRGSSCLLRNIQQTLRFDEIENYVQGYELIFDNTLLEVSLTNMIALSR